MAKPWGRYVSLGYLCLATVAMVSGVFGECENTPPKCTCHIPRLTCTDLELFPDPVPAGITTVLISDSQFTRIPTKLSITNVTTLELYNTLVDEIEHFAFSNMAALETLVISRSNIDVLHGNSFQGLTSLTKLELEDATFKTLPPEMFEMLPALRELSLDSNNLTFTDTTFEKVSENLEVFSCIGCDLTAVPLKALQFMPNLLTLHLSLNPLRRVQDKAFSRLPKLTELELDSVGLTELTDFTFQGLTHLRKLRLSNNPGLTQIPEKALHDQDDLEELYLENNGLGSLHKDLVDWGKLKHLNLSHNPWVCDCNLYWLNDVAFDSSTTVKCFSPEEFKGYTVHNATQGMSCNSGPDGSTIALAIAIPIMIICVCLLVYYIYKFLQARRKKGERKSVRYSAVYRDTTEAKQDRRPTSEL